MIGYRSIDDGVQDELGRDEPNLRKYRPCSGQGKDRKHWAIALSDQSREWWRAKDKGGRVRLFATYEAAEKAALKLEKQNPYHAADGHTSDQPYSPFCAKCSNP